MQTRGDGGGGAAEASVGSAPPPVPMRAFATIWLTLFLDLFGFGIVIPVLPYYASEHGASPAVVALLATTFSLAQFVMSPVLGRLSDLHGRRPIMLVSIAGSCLSMLVLGFAATLWMVFLARLVSGTANANVSTANAYIADRVPVADRARYMGMMGSAVGIGFVLGPAAGGLLSTEALPELPFFCAAGLAAINFAMALRWLPESRPPQHVGPPRRRTPWSGLARMAELRGTSLGALAVVSFGFFLAFSAMESMFALLTEARFGWTARDTGYLFSLVGACITFSQAVLLGRLVRRFGEKRTLVLGMLVQSAGLLVIGGAMSVPPMVIGAAMLATGNGLVSPVTSALVSRMSSAEDQGLNLGVIQSASALARIFGPAIAGVLFERVAPGAPMFAAAAVALGVLVLVSPRIEVSPAR
jgi:DHA1 family tetracycline resistance protein-like MFS transporter